MTEYTADDFARAEFARHPDGGVAARIDPRYTLKWAVGGYGGYDWMSDAEMAREDWSPVQACPDPDEHHLARDYPAMSDRATQWQERAEKAERERDMWHGIAMARPARPLTPDDVTADAYERGVPVLRDACPSGFKLSIPAHEAVRAIVAAVLTEPQRPEGLDDLIDTIGEATYHPEPVALGEALYRAGVRVTGGDDR